MHLVVNGKTRDSSMVHVLMPLGEEGKTPPKVEYWMSYPLVVDRPNCGKTCDYSDAEEQFRQKELPPPPDGYSNRLAPLPVPCGFPSEEN
jgi:hypothetical protein